MFRIISILTALVCLILLLLLLLSPATYLATYGVTAPDEAAFMVRRAAPMFAGFAVLLWLVRDAGPSVLRNGVAIAIAVAFAGVAVTGIYEYLRGFASAMILAAAAGELLIAGLFLRSTRA